MNCDDFSGQFTVLSHFPESCLANFRQNLGLFLLQAGDLSADDSEFREAPRLKPLYAEAHYNLALALHQQGKEAESRAEFNKLMKFSRSLETRLAVKKCYLQRI
jgi:Flp pilus assembly protein TadD